MHKYILITTVLLSQVANAALIFGQGDELTPINPDIHYNHPHLDKVHLLTKEQLENGLIKDFRERAGIAVTPIPQTCWDLFALLNYCRGEYELPDVPYNKECKVYYERQHFEDYDAYIGINQPWAYINNEFIQYIRGNGDVLSAFQERRFADLSQMITLDICRHLQRYDGEVEKLYGSLDGRFESAAPEVFQILLFSSTHFPQLLPLLLKATEIEQECYDQDRIPFWRHSRTNFTVDVDHKEHLVCDVPLYRALEVNYTENDDPIYEYKLACGTMSYGFSLLNNFINDGWLRGLGSYGPGSACAMSYYMHELLNRVYAQGRLPFYVLGQNGPSSSPESVAEKLPANTMVSVIRFHKKFFDPHAEAEKGGLPKGSNWFVPRIFPNDWIRTHGEASHPRHRGTKLKKVEEGNKGVYAVDTMPKNDRELFELVQNFVDQTNAMQILVLNGKVLAPGEAQEECQEILAQRLSFAQGVLSRHDAVALLEPVLQISENGIDFTPPKKK